MIETNYILYRYHTTLVHVFNDLYTHVFDPLYSTTLCHCLRQDEFVMQYFVCSQHCIWHMRHAFSCARMRASQRCLRRFQIR